ncbi:MAG: acetyl-CoA carboxylase, biotin carboxyl carrier protein [Candidatus Omnitrophica bacterium CG11_big_fil_rev_8_21_14_0_20_64_10]|nr:MAG: acetyl-CoA carboxylase, biotin carboxyl carrier protein [Candidatus Omnitrophica bacterium CG11_big_fil_rev_8_21_14_0_20_64_10]
MNLKELKELIALMNENDLGEIEVEREGTRIVLRKRGGRGGVTVETVPAPVPVAPQPAAPAPAPVEPVPSGVEVKSPMVGTFYRAPAPDAAPFVEVGQTVRVGQVLCIIEAMKLMNEIKCETSGKIIKILVENAHPVEFGQPLFVIEP